MIEDHALVAVTLNKPLYSDKKVREHSLRTCVPTPEPARNGSEEEQPHGKQEHQYCQIEDVLRPENNIEDVKLPVRDIEKNGLPAVQFNPGDDEINSKKNRCEDPFDGPEFAFDSFRVDLFLPIKCFRHSCHFLNQPLRRRDAEKDF